jgi:hypothetical protein
MHFFDTIDTIDITNIVFNIKSEYQYRQLTLIFEYIISSYFVICFMLLI